MVETVTSAVSPVIKRNNVTVSGRADGPVMMFAHGYGCDQDMWRRLLPYFSDTYRLVLFDNVGAGRSDVNAYDRDKYGSLDGYAADLLEICDALDLEDVILVAHSVSAMVAVIAAGREPERFSRLVLVAPSPRYIKRLGRRLLWRVLAGGHRRPARFPGQQLLRLGRSTGANGHGPS